MTLVMEYHRVEESPACSQWFGYTVVASVVRVRLKVLSKSSSS